MDYQCGQFPLNSILEEKSTYQCTQDEYETKMNRKKRNLGLFFRGERPFIWLLGPPGTGKRTQGVKISEMFGYVHVSVPDLLVKESQVDSERGEKVAMLLESKKKFPEDMALTLLKEALTELSESYPTPPAWLVSGYPRLLNEAYRFEREIGRCCLIVYMWADSTLLSKRIFMKNAQSHTPTPPNLEYYLDKYHERIIPLLQTYSNRLEFIDASNTAENVFLSIKETLESFQESLPKHSPKTYESQWLNFPERDKLIEEFREKVPWYMPEPVSTISTEDDIPDWWQVESSTSQVNVESAYNNNNSKYPTKDERPPAVNNKQDTKNEPTTSLSNRATPTLIPGECTKHTSSSASTKTLIPCTAQLDENSSNAGGESKSAKFNIVTKSSGQQKGNQSTLQRNLSTKNLSQNVVKKNEAPTRHTISSLTQDKKFSTAAKVVNANILGRSNTKQGNISNRPEKHTVVMKTHTKQIMSKDQLSASKVSTISMSSEKDPQSEPKSKAVKQRQENKQNSKNLLPDNKIGPKVEESQKCKQFLKSQPSLSNISEHGKNTQQLQKSAYQETHSEVFASLPGFSKGMQSICADYLNEAGRVLRLSEKNLIAMSQEKFPNLNTLLNISLTLNQDKKINVKPKNKKLTTKSKVSLKSNKEENNVGDKRISSEVTSSPPSKFTSTKPSQKGNENIDKNEPLLKPTISLHNSSVIDVEQNSQGEVILDGRNAKSSQFLERKFSRTAKKNKYANKERHIKRLIIATKVTTSATNTATSSNCTPHPQMEITGNYSLPTIAEINFEPNSGFSDKGLSGSETDSSFIDNHLGQLSTKSMTGNQCILEKCETTTKLLPSNTQQTANSLGEKNMIVHVDNKIKQNSKIDMCYDEEMKVSTEPESKLIPPSTTGKQELFSRKLNATQTKILKITKKTDITLQKSTHEAPNTQDTTTLEQCSKRGKSCNANTNVVVQNDSEMKSIDKQQSVKIQQESSTLPKFFLNNNEELSSNPVTLKQKLPNNRTSGKNRKRTDKLEPIPSAGICSIKSGSNTPKTNLSLESRGSEQNSVNTQFESGILPYSDTPTKELLSQKNEDILLQLPPIQILSTVNGIASKVLCAMASTEKVEPCSRAVPTIRVSESDASKNSSGKSISRRTSNTSNSFHKTTKSLKVKSPSKVSSKQSANMQTSTTEVPKLEKLKGILKNSCGNYNNLEQHINIKSNSISCTTLNKLLTNRNANNKTSYDKQMFANVKDNSNNIDLNSREKSAICITKNRKNTESRNKKLRLNKMSDCIAVVNNADMSKEGLQDAVVCATQAPEKYNILKRRPVMSELYKKQISLVESSNKTKDHEHVLFDETSSCIRDKHSLKGVKTSKNSSSSNKNNVTSNVSFQLTPQRNKNHSAPTKSTYDKLYSTFEDYKRGNTLKGNEINGTKKPHCGIDFDKSKPVWISQVSEVEEPQVNDKQNLCYGLIRTSNITATTTEKSMTSSVNAAKNSKTAHQIENLQETKKFILKNILLIEPNTSSSEINSHSSNDNPTTACTLVSSNKSMKVAPVSPKIYLQSNESWINGRSRNIPAFHGCSTYECFSDETIEDGFSAQSDNNSNKEYWLPFSSGSSVDICATPVKELSPTSSEDTLMYNRSSEMVNYFF